MSTWCALRGTLPADLHAGHALPPGTLAASRQGNRRLQSRTPPRRHCIVFAEDRSHETDVVIIGSGVHVCLHASAARLQSIGLNRLTLRQNPVPIQHISRFRAAADA